VIPGPIPQAFPALPPVLHPHATFPFQSTLNHPLWMQARYFYLVPPMMAAGQSYSISVPPTPSPSLSSLLLLSPTPIPKPHPATQVTVFSCPSLPPSQQLPTSRLPWTLHTPSRPFPEPNPFWSHSTTPLTLPSPTLQLK